MMSTWSDILKDTPYIIAEIGLNHNGSLELAKHLVSLAKTGGAHAVKFQSFRAHNLIAKQAFLRNSLTDSTIDETETKTKIEQFQALENDTAFGETEFQDLASYCTEIGIDFLSTAFDSEAVDYLETLVPFYKVASGDITCLPLLRKVASKKKPVILSTGCAGISEIDSALEILKEHGASNVVLLHCIMSYPCKNEDANLGMILGLKRAFPNHLIGYSDHTLPSPSMFTLTMAVAMGAVIIEKHFTNDKTFVGNDHFHSMDANDLQIFVQNINLLKKLKGNEHKKPIPAEIENCKTARRSIVLSRSMEKNSILCEADVTYKRAGYGISPIHWDAIIGKRISSHLEKDHILSWKDLE